MSKKELEFIISVIELKYDIKERNTIYKIKQLIKKHFNKIVDEQDISLFYGLTENYEKESKRFEYGITF